MKFVLLSSYHLSRFTPRETMLWTSTSTWVSRPMLWTSDVVKDPWFPLVKDPSEVCPSVLLPPKSIYNIRRLVTLERLAAA